MGKERKGLEAAVERFLEETSTGWELGEFSRVVHPLEHLAKEADRGWPRALEGRAGVLETMAKMRAQAMFEELEKAVSVLGSPLEEMFLYGLVFAAWRQGAAVEIHQPTVMSKLDLTVQPWQPDVYEIIPQPLVADVHPDFLVRGRFLAAVQSEGQWPQAQVAVECDGHDFHEKTKAQASRDKARDRKLASLAAPVVRFSGSEIYSDPIERGAWIISHVRHLAWRPHYERTFRSGGPEELQRVAASSIQRRTLEEETGPTVSQWATQLGFKLTEGG